MTAPTSKAENELAEQLEQQTGLTHDAAVQVLRAHSWDLAAARASILASTSASPPPSQRQGWLSWGWTLARSTLTGTWWLATSAFSLFFGSNGNDRTTANFRSQFAEEFGATTQPPFFEGTFAEALETARAADKLLLVYLHAALHGDTPRFCRDTLCAQPVVAFLAQHFVVWGVDIRTQDGFTRSNALAADGYPYFAVIFAGCSPPQCVASIAGFRDPEEFMAELLTVVEGPGAELLRNARAQQTRAREGRALREEQQLAFQQSLAADREKERRRLEEDAARAEAQRRKQQTIDARIAAVKRRKEMLLGCVEPGAEESGVKTVAVRLPSGQRVMRRFRNDETLELIFAFADSHLFQSSAPETLLQCYTLCTNFPRSEYSWDQASSVRVATLGDQALMYVQLQEDEEDDKAEAAAEDSAAS